MYFSKLYVLLSLRTPNVFGVYTSFDEASKAGELIGTPTTIQVSYANTLKGGVQE